MVQDGLFLSHHERQVGQRIEHHSLSCRSPYFVQAAQDMSPATNSYSEPLKTHTLKATVVHCTPSIGRMGLAAPHSCNCCGHRHGFCT